MGRLEKIVVLTVLFLVAVILAVSLNTGSGVADPSDEFLAGAGEGQATPEDSLRPVQSGSQAGSEAPAGLLSSMVGGGEEAPASPALSRPQAAPGAADKGSILPQEGSTIAPVQADPVVVAAQPKTAPKQAAKVEQAPRPFLLTTEGLAPSRVDDLMIYTWAEGDSFTSLSDRYFGSRLETGRLRSVNEGRDESTLSAGDKIFVPSKSARAVQQLERTSRVAGQWLGAGVYVVQSGDMLGTISKDVYGSAAKWRKIFDANRDLLSSPDQLKVGMKLRIPTL